jgi:hypothetical protein
MGQGRAALGFLVTRRVTCDTFIIIIKPNVCTACLNMCKRQRAAESWEARGLVAAEASAITSRGALCDGTGADLDA